MENVKQPRILILCTQPYHPMCQSRSLDSYFHSFPRDQLCQVFSDARTPIKGLCASLYQITDYQLLCRWKKRNTTVGRIYYYDDLPKESINEKRHLDKAKKWKGDGLYRFVRKLLWKKRFWNTQEFQKWICNVAKPDAIFLCFSPDFFFFEICEEIRKITKAKLLLSITDDLVFNRHFSLSPFYWLYRQAYERKAKQTIKQSDACFFVSNKIKKFYEANLGSKGYVQYIATNLPKPGEIKSPSNIRVARYLGMIESGRYESLCEVAEAFKLAGMDTVLEVYTPSYVEVVNKTRPDNLILKKPISYEKTLEAMRESDLLVMVEGMRKKDQKTVAYSLSTKVADSLGSGKLVLAYGGENTGLLSFVKEKNACLYATDFNGLVSVLKNVSDGKADLSGTILRSLETAHSCFDLEKQSRLFLERVQQIINYRKD